MYYIIRSNDSFNFPLGLLKYIVIVVCYPRVPRFPNSKFQLSRLLSGSSARSRHRSPHSVDADPQRDTVVHLQDLRMKGRNQPDKVITSTGWRSVQAVRIVTTRLLGQYRHQRHSGLRDRRTQKYEHAAEQLLSIIGTMPMKPTNYVNKLHHAEPATRYCSEGNVSIYTCLQSHPCTFLFSPDLFFTHANS